MDEASQFRAKQQIVGIGWVSSMYDEKFGVPRQSGVIPESIATIHFHPEFGHENAFRKLDQFSHIWVIFSFNKAIGKGWSDLVRPPELGGNEKVGIFASRSPFRPNHLGLSVLKLEEIYKHPDYGWSLKVSGADVVHGTPVYDVKPYVPYADAIPDALSGYSSPPAKMEVQLMCEKPESMGAEIYACLMATIQCDPRPQYQEGKQREYGMRIAGWNVCWRVEGDIAMVSEITLACE